MASSIFKAQSLIRLERCLIKHNNKWNLVHIKNPNLNIIKQSSIRFLTTCTPYLNENPEKKDLSEKIDDSQYALTTGQKVKEAGKTAVSGAVVLFGVGALGTLVWYVANELFFGFSSSAVYSKALDIVKDNEAVQYEIGETMKGFGEETSRGRRKHVSYVEYTHEGLNYMRVQFYVKGAKGKGTVHTEAVETSKGRFDFRYIFVELDKFPPVDPIIVVDNR